MSNRGRRTVEEAAEDRAHLSELPDGCGCAEVWEHLSDARGQPADD
jgi:hypothetical protein